MAPKRKVSEGKNALPPVKAPPMLQKRKSSSLSALDIKGGAPGNDAAENEESGFPRIDRKISSVSDFRPPDGDNKAKRKKTHGSKNKKAPTSGWANAESGVSLPNVGAIKPSTAKYRRVNTRRRHAGDIMLTRPATIAVVVKYQLGQHELKKFKSCFGQIDLDSSGMIDYDEFFEFIDETKTPFSEGLFRMIDSDSNGTIDFEEFVHATVLYCMYTRDEILHFAFDTFDPAATGSIGDKELRRLVGMVNDGQSQFSGNINNGLTEFDRNKDGVIDFEEFKNMNKRFPMLLFPCFRLQDRMQKATLGDNHWLQLHKRLYERLKIENYQRKHNGALPSLTLVGAIVKFLRLDSRDVYQP